MHPPLDNSESRNPVSVRFSAPEKKKLATQGKKHGEETATWIRVAAMIGCGVIDLQEEMEDYVRNSVNAVGRK